MFYKYTLTIPANTALANAEIEEFTLPKGTITRVELDFAHGPKRLVNVAIFHNEYKVWPTNPDEWFAADGYVIAFDESYELTSAWNFFTIRGYSDAPNHSHEVVVRLVVSEKAWGLAELISLLTARPKPVEVPE